MATARDLDAKTIGGGVGDGAVWRQARRALPTSARAGGCRSRSFRDRHAGHFQLSDLPLLVRYCQTISLAKRAEDELGKTLIVRGKPSPYLEIHSKAVRSMDVLATKLRLSPRARVASARSPKQQLPPSFYDRQAMQEGDR